ncbi:hypothetical protein D047_3191A, partial [Vibrio parahaemolyticus VPTS-2010_2]
MNTIP